MMKINTLSEALIGHSKECKRGIHIINQKETEKFISYKSLYEGALKVLYNLQALNIKEGQELILQIEDEKNEQFIYVFWACVLGKIIPVPVSANFKENSTKIIKIYKSLKNPSLIINEKCYESLKKNKENNELLLEIESRRIDLDALFLDNGNNGVIKKSSLEELVYIQFSSGSTGDSKGVMLTNKNLITNIRDINKGSDSTSEDKMMSWMPLTHDMGMIGFHLYPLVFNLDQFIMRTSLFIRYPVLWMKKISDNRVTLAASSNFGLRYFLDNFKNTDDINLDLSCIRKIYNGAEPIDIEIINEFYEKLSEYGLSEKAMFPVYGMAEASLAVAFTNPDEKFKTVIVKADKLGIGDKVIFLEEGKDKTIDYVELVEEGYSLENCNIRIVGMKQEVYEEGRVGYVHISGDNVTNGYYNRPELTSKLIDAEGWVNTTDLGFIKDGKLILTGRSQDLIEIDGKSYYAHSIEKECEVLKNIITGRVAVCLKDSKLLVFVLFKRKIENFIAYIDDIKKLIKSKYDIEIKYVIPTKSIPKTTSGKVQRYKLEEMYNDGQFDDVIKELSKFA